MDNLELKSIIQDFEVEKNKVENELEEVIENSIVEYSTTLPEDIRTKDFKEYIDHEVKLKLAEFNKSIDIKPKALYYSLKAELEVNEDATREELIASGYDFLEKTTKNKLLRKIIGELKKES